MITPRRNPVLSKCTTDVRVVIVFPNPISAHIIECGRVHWKFTIFFWYSCIKSGVSMFVTIRVNHPLSNRYAIAAWSGTCAFPIDLRR